MIGAITGDIIGSVYEFDNIKTTVFPFFTRKSNYTDDTIMTVAVTDWLLYGGNLVQVMHRYGREFPCPMGGYGARFGQNLPQIVTHILQKAFFKHALAIEK